MMWSYSLPNTVKHAVSMVLMAAVAGCGMTESQSTFKTTTQEIHASALRWGTCVASLSHKASYQAVLKRMPLPGLQPSLDQLASNDIASDEEIADLRNWHVELQVCRDSYVSEMASNSPIFVPVTNDDFSGIDEVYAKISRKEISWGVANDLLVKNKKRVDVEAVRIGTAWGKEVGQKTQQELAERREAWQAVGGAIGAAAGAYQAARAPAVIYQPVPQTHCFGTPFGVSCSSY